MSTIYRSPRHALVAATAAALLSSTPRLAQALVPDFSASVVMRERRATAH